MSNDIWDSDALVPDDEDSASDMDGDGCVAAESDKEIVDETNTISPIAFEPSNWMVAVFTVLEYYRTLMVSIKAWVSVACFQALWWVKKPEDQG
jgi:hypothetical protein